MGFPSRWKSILKEEQAKVPSGASFDEYKKAAKRASARYRGKETRSNPSGKDLTKIALIAGAAFVGMKVLNSQKKAPVEPVHPGSSMGV